MRIVYDLINLALISLIAIGDVVIFIFKFLFNTSKKIISKSIILKRHKRLKKGVIFPLPVALKLKYFTGGMVFSLIFIFIPLLTFIFLQSLPNPIELSLRQAPQTSKIYDRNSNLLYQIYATQNRTVVPLSQIPLNLRNATISIEDKDFYKHPGFDISAIIRSIVFYVRDKKIQGGSTLTQQLIKSALLTPEKSIERKFKEIILAFWAERLYSKNQILEMYLNQVPYGGTAWGVEAASQVYFGKSVKDLDLAESAFMAALPQAPTIYSPFGSEPKAWKNRQKEVLKKMAELKYISQNDSKKALEEELVFQSPQTPIFAPHFVMYVKDYLVRKYGISMVEKGGLTVITTLDLKEQQMAQQVVSEEVENNLYLHLTNGAALITNPKNGDILAMVGSKGYNSPDSGNVNLTTRLRQPGSSIKVVTYSAALSKGFTPATFIDDSPITYRISGAESYSPVNYDGKFRGKVSLRIALANSLNVPAVKVLNQIGVPTMVELGKKMGITTWGDPQNYGLAITLGAADTKMVDMATVYGTLANGGVRVDVNPIIKITDYKGDILEQKGENNSPWENQGKRVLDKGVVFILTSILSDNLARSMEFGINSPLNIQNHTVSVKTGTSDNKRDNWTIGYTPSYAVTVWVGNNDNSPMSQSLASGITGAAPIWNKIMTNLLKDLPDEKLDKPDNVIEKQCIGRIEYFIKGTENLVNCSYVPPTPSPTKAP